MNLDQLQATLGSNHSKRLFWVLGSPVGRGFATGMLLEQAGHPVQRFSFDLRLHTPTEVLQALSAQRAVSGRGVFLVRHADLWGGPVDGLKHWLSRKSPDILIMESSLRQWKPENWDKVTTDDFLPDMRSMVNSSKCALVNTEFAKSKAGFLKLRTLISQVAGSEPWETKLICDAGRWSTGLTLAHARRLEKFPRVNEALVKVLAPEPALPDFVDSLIAGDKKAALEAPFTPYQFERLHRALDVIGLISRNRRGTESAFELSRRIGLPQIQVSRLMAQMKHFDSVSLTRRMQAVAHVSALYKQSTGEDERRAATVLLISLW